MAIFVAGLAAIGAFFGGQNTNNAVQQVANSVNLQSITSVLASSNALAKVNVFGNQSFTFISQGCTVGSFDVNQINQTGVEVINTATLNLNTSIVNMLQSQILNTLNQTFTKTNTDLLQFLDIFQRGSNTVQTLNNDVSQIIQNNVTSNVLAQLQAAVFNQQTNTIICQGGSFAGFTIDQQLVVNAVFHNIATNVTTAVINNSEISGIVNNAQQQVTLDTQSFLGSIAGIITIVIIVIAVIVVVVFVSLWQTGIFPPKGPNDEKYAGDNKLLVQAAPTPEANTPTPKHVPETPTETPNPAPAPPPRSNTTTTTTNNGVVRSTNTNTNPSTF